jgi:hypothetical protein
MPQVSALPERTANHEPHVPLARAGHAYLGRW